MYRGIHAYFQTDLFHTYNIENFKFKRGSGTVPERKAIYKYGQKKDMVSKIFGQFMKLVVEDVIKNGTTFHFPTRGITMFTWIKIQGDYFKKAYQSGKCNNVDFIASDFTIYIPIFKYFYRGRFKEKCFIVDDSLKRACDAKTSEGFKYC